MGGEGPYINLTPEDIQKWTRILGITPMSVDDMEAAYARAREFFMDRKRLMESDFGWTTEDSTTDLFRITGSSEHFVFPRMTDWLRSNRPTSEHFAIPTQFSQLMDPTQTAGWRRELGISSSYMFKAQRPYRTFDTYIEGPAPLCDILHLLQTIAPGVLIIVRVDDIDDVGEEYTVHALPSKTWMEANRGVLEHVLGSTGRYPEIYGSADRLQTEMLSSYVDDRPDPDNYYTTMWGFEEPKDYTACDSQCGYCGTCEY